MGEKIKSENAQINDENKKARIIDFYAYKGGIGKTTALIKTAILLASKGKKTAIIDMDFEEPGFYEAFSSDIRLEGGVIKYLFDKMHGTSNEQILEGATLAKKLYLKKSGAVYIIGAGRVDKEYFKMLEYLKEKRLKGNREIEILIKDLTKAYSLDYILIDSRNGMNNFAGLSVANMADEVIMFTYPDMENVKGINLSLEMIENNDKCSIVFSKVDNSENALNQAMELLKKINIRQGFRKIDYDPKVAIAVKNSLENNLNRYSFLSDIILEGEVKMRNRKAINRHKEEINTLLDNLSSGKDFNKIMTNDELKVLKSDVYSIIIDDKIDLKKIIEGYNNKIEVSNFKFYNIQIKKAIEKYCKADEFLDVCCLSILALARFNLEGKTTTDIEGCLKKYFMNFYYKSSTKKGRILNASSYFAEFLKEKNCDKDKIICVNIDDMMQYISVIEGTSGISKTNNSVLFRMLYLIFNVLNRNAKFQFKLVLHDRKYKNDENFLKEFESKIINLSWMDLYKNQMIIEKVKIIFDKLFKQRTYAKVNKELLFPLSVEEEGNKLNFDEWFASTMKKHKLLSKRDVLKVIQESAAIENKENTERDSIITLTKLRTAIERVSFR